jgi:hypothetical protein
MASHEHSRPLARRGIVPGQIALQDLIALFVFDDFGLHGGVEQRGE